MTRFEQTTQKWGLTISEKKTKTLIVKNSGVRGPHRTADIRREPTEMVSNFVYLGCLMEDTSSSNAEIKRRISIGACKFQKLREVWRQRDIILETKMSIYRATVLATVLYGSESWTCTENDYRILNAFNTRRLRAIVGLRRDQISNSELFKLTNMISLEKYVKRNRLRWAGHVRRMPDERLPKKMLFGKVVGGSRGAGRPKKIWTQCLEEDCGEVGVSYGKWTTAAAEDKRAIWRQTISSLTSQRKK